MSVFRFTGGAVRKERALSAEAAALLLNDALQTGRANEIGLAAAFLHDTQEVEGIEALESVSSIEELTRAISRAGLSLLAVPLRRVQLEKGDQTAYDAESAREALHEGCRIVRAVDIGVSMQSVSDVLAPR